MTLLQEQLLALLKLALHPEEAVPEVLRMPIAWREIFEEAKRQAVVGMAFMGLEAWKKSDIENKDTLQPDRKTFTAWYGLTEKVRKQNLVLNHKTGIVIQHFTKDGFRATVMKGQGNALLYPEPLMRCSGDVDVWVDGGFEKVNAYVQKISPTNEVNELEIQFKVFKDVCVEVHFRPFIMRNPWKNRRLQAFFESQADACFENRVMLDDGEKPIETILTTLQFNLVHQLAHIHLHLFTEGIGLRQLMDYYFLLLQEDAQGYKTSTVKVVEDLGLTAFASALQWILQEVFGLPEDKLFWKSNENDGRFLLAEVLQSGNFGHLDENNIAQKEKAYASIWMLFFRNLKYFRFDHWDWLFGPLWRIYHRVWKMKYGFK